MPAPGAVRNKQSGIRPPPPRVRARSDDSEEVENHHSSPEVRTPICNYSSDEDEEENRPGDAGFAAPPVAFAAPPSPATAFQGEPQEVRGEDVEAEADDEGLEHFFAEGMHQAEDDSTDHEASEDSQSSSSVSLSESENNERGHFLVGQLRHNTRVVADIAFLIRLRTEDAAIPKRRKLESPPTSMSSLSKLKAENDHLTSHLMAAGEMFPELIEHITHLLD